MPSDSYRRHIAVWVGVAPAPPRRRHHRAAGGVPQIVGAGHAEATWLPVTCTWYLPGALIGGR
ncbi:hypothetical protein [Mycobacterium sp. SMC-14]|uniref:hypothetical protein n=1 Tax=Mycobacterium sp. SMC-14 TaxID=3385968 RepID=UPI00390C5F74